MPCGSYTSTTSMAPLHTTLHLLEFQFCSFNSISNPLVEASNRGIKSNKKLTQREYSPDPCSGDRALRLIFAPIA